MKIGDLVLIAFGDVEPPKIGIFLGKCTWAALTRADVFWDGEIISTPLVQIELLNASR